MLSSFTERIVSWTNRNGIILHLFGHSPIVLFNPFRVAEICAFIYPALRCGAIKLESLQDSSSGEVFELEDFLPNFIESFFRRQYPAPRQFMIEGK